MSCAAIEVDLLEKTYCDGLLRRRKVHALRGVSFSVEPGSIFGLLGPNGAGKTTLIKVLLGLVRASGGKASVLGQRAGDRATRRKIGYLPENHRMPRHLTGAAALAYYGGLSGLCPAEVRRRSKPLLQRVGLEAWGNVSVRKYSKGMLQRLGLAQAMLHDPQLLILDEPTDGVDPVGRKEMRRLLQELRAEGKTVFINSHLLQEIELVCDRAAILARGSLCREGTIDQLRACRRREVEFIVAGEELAIRAAVGEALGDLTRAADAGWRFVLPALDQPCVNGCVDRLRAGGIDIVSLRPVQQSLEDAFLNFVAEGADGVVAAEDAEDETT